jgi:DNA polymerase
LPESQFVGPASRELDRGLEAAGIDRKGRLPHQRVKHFKFEERGRRRIHQTPKRFEVEACTPWLEAELRGVKPRCWCCSGHRGEGAARELVPVTQHRGELLDSELAPVVTATIHPSAILRAPDDKGPSGRAGGVRGGPAGRRRRRCPRRNASGPAGY